MTRRGTEVVQGALVEDLACTGWAEEAGERVWGKEEQGVVNW